MHYEEFSWGEKCGHHTALRWKTMTELTKVVAAMVGQDECDTEHVNQFAVQNEEESEN